MLAHVVVQCITAAAYMWICVELYIHWSTPSDKVRALHLATNGGSTSVLSLPTPTHAQQHAHDVDIEMGLQPVRAKPPLPAETRRVERMSESPNPYGTGTGSMHGAMLETHTAAVNHRLQTEATVWQQQKKELISEIGFLSVSLNVIHMRHRLFEFGPLPTAFVYGSALLVAKIAPLPWLTPAFLAQIHHLNLQVTDRMCSVAKKRRPSAALVVSNAANTAGIPISQRRRHHTYIRSALHLWSEFARC